MQTVWSRIAQTRISCHCPSCVHVHVSTAGGVARRATTTTGRRPVRWAISSTFVYSGIFAAAATTDAGMKQKRRDQWDRAIADIKHDLERPVGEEMATYRQEETRTTEETVRFKPMSEDPLEALLEAASQVHNGPIWPTNTGTPLIRRNLAPQSVYAADWQREKASLSRWTPKKLRMTELEIDKFILRMLLHLDDLGMRAELPTAVPESCHSFFLAPAKELDALLVYTNSQYFATSRLEPLTDPERLPTQHQYGVTYLQDDTGDHHQTANHLNYALHQLFEKRKNGQLSHSELVGKICYNLSISSAAPNVNCWNTILTGLLENDQDAALVWHAIPAIRHSNTRMNEVTMTCILKYYTAIDDSRMFARFIDQMRGLYGGLALARGDINITDVGRSRLIQDAETGKIYQKPYPTPGVFEALIRGVLHFVGFDAAIRVCRDMGMQGWGLSIRGLTPLLDDRAMKADWETGWQVWEQIKMLQDESRWNGQPERLFPQTYTAMLRLCSTCNKTDKFDEILREALAAKHPQRMLLDLFKQEFKKRPNRRIPPPNSTRWEDIEQRVLKEDLEKIVPKEYGYMTRTRDRQANIRSSAEISQASAEEDWIGELPKVHEVIA